MSLLIIFLGAAVAATPLYAVRLTVADIPIYLPEWFILAGLSWWVGLLVTRQTRLVWPPRAAIGVTLLFVVGAGISSFQAGFEALGALKSWVVLPALFGFLGYQALASQAAARRRFELTLLVTAVAVGLYGIFKLVAVGGRLESFFNSPNAAAMWLVPVFFILLNRFRQRSFAIGLVLIIVSVFLTKSFGGIAALGIGLVVTWLAGRSKNSGQKATVLSASIISLTLLSYLSLTSRLSLILQNIFGDRLGGRLQIWAIGQAGVAENWFYGIGPDQFSGYYLGRVGSFFGTPIEWNVPEPHNLYLATWLSSGLVGFIGFFGLVALLIFEQIKNRQPALLGALTAVLVHGLVDTPYWKNDLSIIFFLIVALTLALPAVSDSATK